MKNLLAGLLILFFISGCVTAKKGDMKYTRFLNQTIDEVTIDSRIDDPNAFKVKIKGQNSKMEILKDVLEILKGV